MYRYLIILSALALLISACGNKDQTAPVVTLNGSAFITVPLNGSYTDEGATANDPEDGDISTLITVTGTVNTDLEGNYEIRYQVTDQAGNGAEAIRIVSVRNDAYSFTGTYQLHSTSATDTLDVLSDINTSTTNNWRIWLQGYGLYSQTVVYADISNDSIFIPKQSAYAGGTYHYFWGEGLIITGDTLKIQCDFNDSLAGTIVSGNSRYTFIH